MELIKKKSKKIKNKYAFMLKLVIEIVKGAEVPNQKQMSENLEKCREMHEDIMKQLKEKEKAINFDPKKLQIFYDGDKGHKEYMFIQEQEKHLRKTTDAYIYTVVIPAYVKKEYVQIQIKNAVNVWNFDFNGK